MTLTLKTKIILIHLHHVDGLVQERWNSSALAMELRLSCTKPIDVMIINLVLASHQYINVLHGQARIYTP